MKQTIIAILFIFTISCQEKEFSIPLKNIEKYKGYSVERTSAGNNLHITGVSTFPGTTYAFYDTIFIYNNGVLNLTGNGYIHADRYVPKLTNGGKATINIDGIIQSGIPKLTIKRINDLGNTNINIINGQLRHDYLYSSNSNAVIRNGKKSGVPPFPDAYYGGQHFCQGEGMIWGTGNYYLEGGQISFSKSVESSVYPTIRLNGGNMWFLVCSGLYTEDLITNANSVAKGVGTIKVNHLAHFNQPLTSNSTIKACINAFATPTQNKTGSATLSCTQGCN